MDDNYSFEEEAISILETLTTAISAGIAVWGACCLMQGYEEDDPELKQYGLDLILDESPRISVETRRALLSLDDSLVC